MSVRVALLVVLAGCFTKPPGPGDVSDGVRREITIVTPPTAPLRDFPVSVVLQNDAAFADAELGHVSFAIGDVPLDCEIVEHDPSTGALDAWVRIPTLPVTAFTFDLVYGTDAISGCEPSSVWPEHRGVWHLSRADSLGRDSTSYQHHAIARNGTPPIAIPGIAGNGAFYNGGGELCAADAPGMDFGQESFSYEVWVQPNALLGEYDMAFAKGGQSDGEPGFDLELGMSEWNAYVRDPVDPFARVKLMEVGMMGRWFHLAVVVDRSENMVFSFLDGALVEGSTLPLPFESVDNDTSLCLGLHAAPMRGMLDEARLHGVARSTAWIDATYVNLAQRDRFMTIGDER